MTAPAAPAVPPAAAAAAAAAPTSSAAAPAASTLAHTGLADPVPLMAGSLVLLALAGRAARRRYR